MEESLPRSKVVWMDVDGDWMKDYAEEYSKKWMVPQLLWSMNETVLEEKSWSRVERSRKISSDGQGAIWSEWMKEEEEG